MRKPLFTGVCTALVTPFTHGKIHYNMLKRLIQRQIDAGINAIVLAGTTGESPTLSDEEKLTMFRYAKDYVRDKCKIIAGTGSNSTKKAVELSAAAEKAGIDAILVVTPYYNKATPAGLIAHYKEIAQAVKIPVILYNVPSRTGVDIPVSVYHALNQVDNIVGVKEASTDVGKIAKIRRACGDDFSIWSGNDELTIPVMALGGRGVISVTSNVAPGEMNAMAIAALEGNYPAAAKMQQELLELMELLFCEVNPIPVKAAMRAIGLDCGECRPPLCPLTDENREKLQKFFS